MAIINPSIPVAGQPNSSEEPKIVTALSQLVGAVNAIDSANISDATIVNADIANGTITTAKLAAVQGCQIYAATGVQTWAAATEAAVAMASEAFDTDSMHSGSLSTATVATAGVYVITGHLDLVGVTAGGLVLVQILKNGVRVAAQQIPIGGQFASVAYCAALVATDTVQLYVRNDSSGTITLGQGDLTVVRVSA